MERFEDIAKDTSIVVPLAGMGDQAQNQARVMFTIFAVYTREGPQHCQASRKTEWLCCVGLADQGVPAEPCRKAHSDYDASPAAALA